MPRPFWVDTAVVLYALVVGATLARAAHGGRRWMWSGAFLLVAVGFALTPRYGGVPIFADLCPVCGYGWDINPFLFALGTAMAGLALLAVRERALPPMVRMLVASAAAFPALWMGTGGWVS